MPRNVDPEVGRVYNVFLYDVDDLGRVVESNRARRTREAERAEVIVEEEAHRFLRWWEGLESVPTIVALREKIESLEEEEMRRLLASLSHLSERDKKRIEQFGAQLAGKFLHLPISRIRNAGEAERCSVLASSLRYLFQLDDEGTESEAARANAEPKDSAADTGEERA